MFGVFLYWLLYEAQRLTWDWESDPLSELSIYLARYGQLVTIDVAGLVNELGATPEELYLELDALCMGAKE